ncbi:Regulatory factor X-associated protein [Fukomys damarensis]|uniref:Regulatory factor X-associated protein n=1 Tax=Fukomys damarensis TaxID=885580 RepID=A0A091D9D6_FUKDA|nr:Regulatory factor X-associated protein [Fukomys damarensis]
MQSYETEAKAAVETSINCRPQECGRSAKAYCKQQTRKYDIITGKLQCSSLEEVKLPPPPLELLRSQESTDNILSMVKQKTGSFGDRPARPTLLEQVLNQKRLSLLRSPEVVQFLQKQQQLLNQQVLEQRQQQFPGASM